MSDRLKGTGFAHAGERAETKEAWEAREAQRRAREASESSVVTRTIRPQAQVQAQTRRPSAKVWFAAVTSGVMLLAGTGLVATLFGGEGGPMPAQAAEQSPEPGRTGREQGGTEAKAAGLVAPANSAESARAKAARVDQELAAAKQRERARHDTMGYVLEEFERMGPDARVLRTQEVIQLSSSASLSNAVRANRELRELLDDSPDDWAEAKHLGMFGPPKVRLHWPEIRVELVVHRYEKYFCNVVFWPTNARMPAKGSDLQRFISNLLGQGFIASETTSYCPIASRASVVGPDGSEISLMKCESVPPGPVRRRGGGPLPPPN